MPETQNPFAQYLALQSELANLRKEERRIESHLDALEKAILVTRPQPPNDVKVTYKTVIKPIPKNWGMIYNYISSTSAYYLLEKRIAKKAYEELRSLRGEAVPGIEEEQISSFTVKFIEP